MANDEETVPMNENGAIKDSGKGLCAQGWAQYCNRNQVVVQLSQFPREQVWRP